jgi:hypothetical protein
LAEAGQLPCQVHVVLDVIALFGGKVGTLEVEQREYGAHSRSFLFRGTAQIMDRRQGQTVQVLVLALVESPIAVEAARHCSITLGFFIIPLHW